MLHPAVKGRREEWARRFRDAQPFRHVVIDRFLDPQVCQELIAEFPSFSRGNARNEFGEAGGKAVVETLREIGPAYARLDGLLASEDFRRWTGDVAGIPRLIHDAAYVGGGTHENIEGQELDPHVDFNYHPKTRLHRRLNLILFLNEEWEETWGGCLQLHLNPWLPAGEDRVETVVPRANRAVLFETTERSWHGFQRIVPPPEKKGLTRRSVAVYYYTRERPPEETVPEHSTYYVPRPLPERFVAGHTLTAADVAELRQLVERRDRQVRFLWEHERELRELVSKVEGSASYRLSRALTWPLRKLKSWTG